MCRFIWGSWWMSISDKNNQANAMKNSESLLRLAQYGDGARASARFIVQSCEAYKAIGPLAVWTLKRRERRAPPATLSGRPIARASLVHRVKWLAAIISAMRGCGSSSKGGGQ